MFLKPIFPVLDYIINYDYIANELCENKAKPELKCNVKCHLVNELAKASEDDKPIHSDIKHIYFHNRTSIVDNYANFYFHKACCSVFHPHIFSA